MCRYFIGWICCGWLHTNTTNNHILGKITEQQTWTPQTDLGEEQEERTVHTKTSKYASITLDLQIQPLVAVTWWVTRVEVLFSLWGFDVQVLLKAPLLIRSWTGSQRGSGSPSRCWSLHSWWSSAYTGSSACTPQAYLPGADQQTWPAGDRTKQEIMSSCMNDEGRNVSSRSKYSRSQVLWQFWLSNLNFAFKLWIWTFN